MSGRDGNELGYGGRDRFRRDRDRDRDRDNQYHYHSNSKYEERSSSHPVRSGRSGLRSSNGRFGSSPPSRHLWVGNLPLGISESDVSQHFRRFGPLESVAFQPGRSYAFVNFAKENDAIDAVEELQGFPIAGNPLRIEFAKADKSLQPSRDQDRLQSRDEHHSEFRESSFSQKEFRNRHVSDDHSYNENPRMGDKNAEPSSVLWVGFPASLNVDETVLRRAFSPFGSLVKITAFPGRSYAFVQYESVASACEAKDALHGKLFGNPRVHICFAKNESGPTNGGRNSMNTRQESLETFPLDRRYSDDPSPRSPQLFPDRDSGYSEFYSRRATQWRGGNEPLEPIYDHQSSPIRRRRGHSDDFARFSQTNTIHEEPWIFPEDVHFQRGSKKLKMNSFPPENELPEYPYSDLEREQRSFPGNVSGFSQADRSNRQYNQSFGHNKQISDFPLDVAPPQREWRGSHDSSQPGFGHTLLNSVERKRLTPNSVSEWKWEGTIAKGGTPICRARCFPVGKVLDIMLPEILDCTARTGLDMLAKHYYQATNAWVVFFVPGSDADIGFYNEFMNYLEEKQRTAVAKLDENTTLFLVPPSNFSEKVLKVPGKQSISGVILSLENPGSYVPQQQPQYEDTTSSSFRGSNLYQKPSTPSLIPSYVSDFSSNPRSHNFDNSRNEYPLRENPINLQSQATSNPAHSVVHHSPTVTTRAMHEASSVHPAAGTAGLGGLHPEQLAQLASTLLGQQRQAGQNELRHEHLINESGQVSRTPQSQNHILQNNQTNSEFSRSQYGQTHQPQMVQRDNPISAPSPEADADPQQRLQATLQLAAALLQQIQQGKAS